VSSKLQHTIIRASAGTGKTHQLANRYIALLLLQSLGGGKIAPEKIVAMTFTRKGAGEFAERILNRLATAADNEEKRRQLQADLEIVIQGDAERNLPGLAPGVTVPFDTETLQSALATMIDQFDRLVLGTIDGFMARSVQTLAFELGLGGFEILEKAATERERQKLLGEVFRTVPPKDLESFHQTLKRATLKSSRSLRRELDTFVKGFHKLLQALHDQEAWGGTGFWNGETPSLGNPSWQKDASSLAGQIHGKDFGHKQVNKSLTAVLDWLAKRTPGSAGSPPAWLATGGKLAELWLDWPQGVWTFDYYNKPRAIPAELMNALRPILESWIAAECTALAEKTAAIHSIVSRYEALYETLARRRGRLTFDDIPLLLDEEQRSQHSRIALQLLAYRWYQRFDHWLLDEFQDTSRVQWGVLQPWLDEAIQDNDGTKSVFVVGDPKQSIYGWRDAEPRLFQELIIHYPGAFKEQIMAESWRSRPAVLELVNRVCTPTTNLALSDPEKFSPIALKRWQYDQHHPEENRSSQPGYSAVLLVSEAEGEEDEASDTETDPGEATGEKFAAQARCIKGVLDRVQPLENGLSTAILVRKNKTAEAIAQWLRANGVPQVMVEGVATLAVQSPIVAAVVDALRWLESPACTLAAGHVRITPLWNVLSQTLEKGETNASPGAVWRFWRRRIANVGSPQVTLEWCSALSIVHREPYAQYCLHHVSQLAHQSTSSQDLHDWIMALGELEVRESAAAGFIHVMTIHKSKGLGFDVVLLPDLDTGGGGHDEILIRRDEKGCATGCLSYPPRWLSAFKPTIHDVCDVQKANQDLEALCVLYVALTRAKEATFVIMNQEKPRKASPVRDWILSAVPDTDPATDNQGSATPWRSVVLHWEHGSRSFSMGIADAAQTITPTQTFIRLPKPVARRKNRKPSAIGHDSFTPSTGMPESSGGQEFGTAVHKVFEQIQWWTPGQYLEGPTDAVELVRKCLLVPAIKDIFTPITNRDEALRGLPVEFMEKDTWWSGIIDRLVLRRDADGTLEKAALIDFKTDRVENAANLRDRYSEQLSIYRRVVSNALKLTDTQVEVVLLSTHLEMLVGL
jgi:ATP-dependent helicase/nuclease subunit A